MEILVNSDTQVIVVDMDGDLIGIGQIKVEKSTAKKDIYSNAEHVYKIAHTEIGDDYDGLHYRYRVYPIQVNDKGEVEQKNVL